MSTKLTPEGLPIWTPKTVPQKYIQRVRDNRRKSPWKHCTICGLSSAETPLYLCEGCTNVDVFESVECQKADWKQHKSRCGEKEPMFSQMFGRRTIAQLEDEVRQIRGRMRMCRALLGTDGPIEWTTRQILHFSGMSPHSCCIVFTMITLVDDMKGPLWPRRIHVKPRDSVEGGETNMYGHYEVHWKDEEPESGQHGVWEIANGSCYLGTTAGESLSLPLPSWLYVFLLCCIFGDVHPEMARVRLELLVDTIRQFPDPEGLLTEFGEDSFIGWELEPVAGDRFHRWRRLVGPTVNL